MPIKRQVKVALELGMRLARYELISLASLTPHYTARRR